jgi:hypothetical protein
MDTKNNSWVYAATFLSAATVALLFYFLGYHICSLILRSNVSSDLSFTPRTSFEGTP